MPAASTTLTCKLPLPLKVWLANVHTPLVASQVALPQLLPPSSETFTVSPLPKAALRRPLMLIAAVLVMKSPPLLPVSGVKVVFRMVCVGAVLSTLKFRLTLPVLGLPAASVRLALRALLPAAPHAALAMEMSTLPALMWLLVKTVVLRAVPPSDKTKLSPTWASEPLVGRVRRTVVVLAASLMLMKPSASLVLPCSTKPGAVGAVVSKVKLRAVLGPLVLPAASNKRALRALLPSLPSMAWVRLNST